MKKAKTVRTLSTKELREIKQWLEKNFGQPPGSQSPEDAVLSCQPSVRNFGRYASISSCGVTIYNAAQLISMMAPASGWSHTDSGEEVSLPEVHTALFSDLKKRIAANDHAFFECLSIMLKHRKKGCRIAELPWRSIKKHSNATFKPSSMSLAREMEFAVFHVLRKRAPLSFLGDDPHKFSNAAVTRKELRKALRECQKRHLESLGRDAGDGMLCRISEFDLSRCLSRTESGRFLARFMAEPRIAQQRRKP